MAARRIRTDEIFGLTLAVLAHAALLGVLLLRPPSAKLIPPPDRITVTLSEDVGLRSISPLPEAKPAPDTAPVQGAPPVAKIEPKPEPRPEPIPPPPVIKPKPLPRVVPSTPPVVRPIAKPLPRIVPSPRPRPVVRPTQAPPLKSAAKVTPAPRAPAPTAPRAAPRASTPAAPRAVASTAARVPAGGSRFSDAFKQGLPAAPATGTARTPAAATIGPAVVTSLNAEVQRQLKSRGRWAVPQGVDTDKLVTFVSFRLNRDGSLAGTPAARTIGQNSANIAQVSQHQERAIRAVQLTAPFTLPAEFYSGWQSIEARFDKRLAQ